MRNTLIQLQQSEKERSRGQGSRRSVGELIRLNTLATERNSLGNCRNKQNVTRICADQIGSMPVHMFSTTNKQNPHHHLNQSKQKDYFYLSSTKLKIYRYLKTKQTERALIFFKKNHNFYNYLIVYKQKRT